MYLSLIIPAYNEEDRIGNTLKLVIDYFACQAYDAEVLVIDDGSTDRTAEVVRGFQMTNDAHVCVESLGKNRGKGYAVRKGMLEHACGDFRFFYDADASTPIEELERCGSLFDGDADILIGSRSLPDSMILRHQAWYREYMGRCYNLIEKVLGITRYADTQCGFKGFSARAAEICFSRQTVDRFSFDAELLYIAERHGLSVVELPVKWLNSPKSKVNPLKDATRMFYDLLAIRMKDMARRYD